LKFKFLALMIFLPTMAEATDIAKTQAKPIELSFMSKRPIFEVERCLIEVDSPGVPTVYRQPDRPNETMIAYLNGMSVPMIINLTSVPTGTRVDVRRKVGPIKFALSAGFQQCS
jgi:hypothetical protein